MENIITFETKITFGRYKNTGATVKDIYKCDPTYLDWCLDNIEWFNMSEEDEIKIRREAEREREQEFEERYCFDYYEFCD